MRFARSALIVAVTMLAPHALAAQVAPPPAPSVPALPPATKLEGFKPTAGSIVTFGYDNLPLPTYGISLDVRELRSATGSVVRGVVVEITQSQYREERSFVDADEIPELLRGITAILEVQSNPTAFKNFEVRYRTRGELELAVFNSGNSLSYALSVGRTLRASKPSMSAKDVQAFQAMLQAAQVKLAALPAK